MSDKPKHTYKAPVPPQAGYRRGFEPRPGESDSARLKRELEELKRRAKGKASGANYDHYNNAAGGTIDKPKPKPMPLPTSPRRVPPSLLPTKPPPKGRTIQKYAKGGSASRRADGCATKGKTKGKMV
jgi:hypothetical protein